MIRWFCNHCGHENIEKGESPAKDAECKNCHQPIGDVMRVFWWYRPNEPDPRFTTGNVSYFQERQNADPFCC